MNVIVWKRKGLIMSAPEVIKPKYVSWILIFKSAYLEGEITLGFFEGEERYKKFLKAIRHDKFQVNLGEVKKDFFVYRSNLKSRKLFLHEVEYFKV